MNNEYRRNAITLSCMAICLVFAATRSAAGQDVDSLFKLEEQAFQRKDWDLVIALCDRIVRLAPREAGAWYDRGQAYRWKKNFKQAAESYRKSLAADPNFARGHKGLGNLYRDQGDYAAALNQLDQAVGLDPRLAKAWGDRAWVLWLKGDYQHAIQNYESAIRLEPNLARYYVGLGWILATCPDAKVRNAKRAFQMASKGYQLEPKNALALDTLAAAYAESKDFKGARRWEQMAIDAGGVGDEAQDAFAARLRLYQENKPYRWDGKSEGFHRGGDD